MNIKRLARSFCPTVAPPARAVKRLIWGSDGGDKPKIGTGIGIGRKVNPPRFGDLCGGLGS
jgi:hypothetical protein